jgi:transposase
MTEELPLGPLEENSVEERPAVGVGRGALRLVHAQREQMELRAFCLNDLLDASHPARLVWAFVERLDTSAFEANIVSFSDRPGRPAFDPKVLLAIWLYATIDAQGSARRISRLCGESAPYQWLSGGREINYHTLSDFRTAHVDALDALLTQSVASLLTAGLVEMKRVAQDGMRVRASAGAASFHREKTLEEHLEEAKAQVAALRAELDEDPSQPSRREKAARERAARERQERLEEALKHVAEVSERKKEKDKEKARASSTDPESRVMKMADGGFRPAFNVEFSTDTATQVIVAVDVVNTGSDQGQMPPIIDQIEERFERLPEEYLVDGGFANKADIEECATQGVIVYAPLKKPKSKDGPIDEKCGIDEKRASDTPGVADWRERMQTEEAKTIYKERASTAECVNAIARNRGLRQFLVRGLRKTRAVALWYVLAHNMMRSFALGQAAKLATG